MKKLWWRIRYNFWGWRMMGLWGAFECSWETDKNGDKTYSSYNSMEDGLTPKDAVFEEWYNAG